MRRTLKWTRNTNNFAVYEFKGPDKMRTVYLPLDIFQNRMPRITDFDVIFSSRPFQSHETESAELTRLKRENQLLNNKLDEIQRTLRSIGKF